MSCSGGLPAGVSETGDEWAALYSGGGEGAGQPTPARSAGSD